MAHHSVQEQLEIGEYLFAGAHEAEHKGKKNEKPPYVTPFGTVETLSAVAMIAQMWTLLTSFFTDSINGAILAEFSGEEVLWIMFLVVFLWFSIAPTLQRIALTVPKEGFGWRMTWVMSIQFLSRVVLLIAFGYAAIFLKDMWIRAGLLLIELLFITAVLALYAFGAYAYFLSQEKIKAQMHK
jgi:hypothetical protein